MDEDNYSESLNRYSKAVQDGSLEKSKWSATLTNGKVIKYFQVDGEGFVNDDGVSSYLHYQANDLGSLDGSAEPYEFSEEEKTIPFSHFGRYPKDVNDPVSVALAIRYLYNQYRPKFSGNFPDIDKYTSLPEGAVE